MSCAYCSHSDAEHRQPVGQWACSIPSCRCLAFIPAGVLVDQVLCQELFAAEDAIEPALQHHIRTCSPDSAAALLIARAKREACEDRIITHIRSRRPR
jgi:hypothetical protein